MISTIKRGTRVFGWTLLVVGLLMGYQGCTRAGGGLATWATGESADGVVTSIRTFQASSPPGRMPFRESSLITFTAADGEVVTFQHPVQGSPPPFAMGEHVRVFYDADAPEDAVAPGGLAMLLLGFGFLFAAGIGVMLTGAVLLLIGALPWIERKQRIG